MTNSRSKGKRNELFFVHKLKEIFPEVHRNWHEQTAKGGVDLTNTDCFDFECKSGRQATLKTIKKWLDQLEEEGSDENYNVVLAKPDKRRGSGDDKFEPYVVLPFEDFRELLSVLKVEGII